MINLNNAFKNDKKTLPLYYKNDSGITKHIAK